MDRFKEHEGEKYVLDLVDEYLTRWMLKSELEFLTWVDKERIAVKGTHKRKRSD